MRQRSCGEFEMQTSKRSVPNGEFALGILFCGPWQDIVFAYDKIPLWISFPSFLFEIICAVWYTNQRELFCLFYFHKVSRNLSQRFHSAINLTFTRCRTNITPGMLVFKKVFHCRNTISDCLGRHIWVLRLISFWHLLWFRLPGSIYAPRVW